MGKQKTVSMDLHIDLDISLLNYSKSCQRIKNPPKDKTDNKPISSQNKENQKHCTGTILFICLLVFVFFFYKNS